ncbi:basement membrane-specific heparan sulfate proteoglycan core protein-like [Watersipora subatra]|uniref:basement membrane-specific heparan sulfate proteoglycan core protein-like n=1 Tax=Watersipora subatra TaxID=2589382 RepID=UPI00355C6869
MLYAQYCLNLLTLTNNVVCGCTCGSDRSLLTAGCVNQTTIGGLRVLASPANRTIDVRQSASFSCQAGGDLMVGIEWQDSAGRKLDSRRMQLTIRNARLSDAGVYHCVAYNYLGESVRDSVRLVVNGKPPGPCEALRPCSDYCEDDLRSPTNYTCSCPSGMRLKSDLRTCEVVPADACAEFGYLCSHTCILDKTQPRGYRCGCPPGMSLDTNQRGCLVPACERLKPCSHACRDDTNDPNRYICSCPTGMSLNPDRRTCICNCPTGMSLNQDRRTCTVNACERLRPCSHYCTDIPGNVNGYTCTCPAGMLISADGRTCIADDPCKSSKPCSDLCVLNTKRPENYECRCLPNRLLNSDGRTCIDVSVTVTPKEVDLNIGGSTSLTCTLNTGNSRNLGWERDDGRPLPSHIRQRLMSRFSSRLSITRARGEDAGRYTCRYRDGSIDVQDTATVSVQSSCDSKSHRCTDICVTNPRASAGYTCQCRSGRYLIDSYNCRDCECNARCVSRSSGVLCYCNLRESCKGDTGMCERFSPCEHYCRNDGSTGFRCSCRSGYKLDSNYRNCSIIPSTPLQVAVDPLVLRVDQGGSGSVRCLSSGGVGTRRASWSPIVADSSFDGEVFTITNAAQSTHERQYTCSVTDSTGAVVRKTANVYIKEPVSVSVTPKYSNVNAGESTLITCTVTGGNSRNLNWQREDGQPLPSHIRSILVSGSSRQLNIMRAQPEDARKFICRYRDGNIDLQDSTTVSVIGGKMTSVSWKFNNQDITNPRIIIGSDGDQLTVPDVRASDEGIYSCDGTTGHTRTSTFLNVFVVCPPQITVGVWIDGKKDENNNRFKVGERAILSCNVTGRPDITEVYWRKRDAAPNLRLATTRTAIADGKGNEEASLTHTLPQLTVADSGTYECRALNSVNQSLISIETVRFDVIAEPPEIQIIGGGAVVQYNPASVQCRVVSQAQNAPFTYTWSFVNTFGKIETTVLPEKSSILSVKVTIENNVRGDLPGRFAEAVDPI